MSSKKEKLALAFELTDDKQIAALAKEYAQANDSFAEFIVEKNCQLHPMMKICMKRLTLFSM